MATKMQFAIDCLDQYGPAKPGVLEYYSGTKNGLRKKLGNYYDSHGILNSMGVEVYSVDAKGTLRPFGRFYVAMMDWLWTDGWDTYQVRRDGGLYKYPVDDDYLR